ncbi:MAG: pyruvate ferredoxin oxidoreductase [bacterium]|nr:pyruvate ferredoxin oxidoreductase [bacterium]
MMEIRLSGSGGQGLVLGGRILARALLLDGLCVAQSQSYEPTSRGGLCRADVVAAESTPDHPLVGELDLLVLLDPIAAAASLELLRDEALVLADSSLADGFSDGELADVYLPGVELADVDLADIKVHSLPLYQTAKRLGAPRVANIVALGALTTLAGRWSQEAMEAAVLEEAPRRSSDLNLQAVRLGLALPEGQRVAR